MFMSHLSSGEAHSICDSNDLPYEMQSELLFRAVNSAASEHLSVRAANVRLCNKSSKHCLQSPCGTAISLPCDGGTSDVWGWHHWSRWHLAPSACLVGVAPLAHLQQGGCLPLWVLLGHHLKDGRPPLARDEEALPLAVPRDACQQQAAAAEAGLML